MSVTRRQAEQALAAVKTQFAAYLTPIDLVLDALSGPRLMKDFDGRDWTIMWEEGPYEWPLVLPVMPKGVWAEAITTYSVGLYPA